MWTVDGSRGEGGGQVLRTALTASLLKQEPIRIRDIRKNRSKPGLLPSHLAAVRAAVAVSGGRAVGDELRSTEIEFHPGPLRPGQHTFSIGTAGSTTLVLQTVLLPLLEDGGAFEIALEGGTHNPKAPPFDFLARTYVPVLRKLGARIDVALNRVGFAPRGGGAFTARIEASEDFPGEVALEERGRVKSTRVRSLLSHLPEHIAERQIARLEGRLMPRPSEARIETIAAAGPGNVVMIEVESDALTEIFTAFGRRHVGAEQIADEVWSEVVFYLESRAVVGPHLADQLVPIMALRQRGGFLTVYPTLHTHTQVELVNELFETSIRVDEIDPKTWRIGY
jgi:RNA 3'-terminal phosphate cyclase (ATP)